MKKQDSTTKLSIERHDLLLREPFTISGYTFTATPIVTVRFHRSGVWGRGEASGVYYVNDTADKAAERLRDFAEDIPADITREILLEMMPPCGARNALDAALWEWEARFLSKQVWEIAGISPPKPLLTTVTLGAEDPGKMAERAVGYDFAKALKLKLTGECELDIARVKAVRAARPDVWMAVDPNQGYVPDTIDPLVSALSDCSISLLEQPFRRGHESEHDGMSFPMATAADESCLNLEELESLPGRFDVVNIKLDKCGGLTEGLRMARRARELGLSVMVGNMVGTSLSAAPACILGQFCDVVDIDGPLFIQHDPAPTASYEAGFVRCSEQVWGPDASLERASASSV